MSRALDSRPGGTITVSQSLLYYCLGTTSGNVEWMLSPRKAGTVKFVSTRRYDEDRTQTLKPNP